MQVMCSLNNDIISHITHFALRDGIVVKMRFQVMQSWYWSTISHKFLVDIIHSKTLDVTYNCREFFAYGELIRDTYL